MNLSTRPIPAVAVRQLYDQVGWWPQRSLEDIAFVLEHGVVVGAWDGDQLIGFARAVSDGRLRAYIEDVMVHPAYRHRGISRQLLAELLNALAHIETISLFCDPALLPVYEPHGFKPHPAQRVLHRQAIK